MSNYEDVYAPDLTEETESTLSGSEQFVMFDSVEGKRAELSTIADYIVANGEIDGSDIPTIVSTIEGNIGTLDTKVGDLTDLDTEDKDNLVAAINEAYGKAEDADAHVGDLTDLDTTDKTDIVSAVNEVNGKAEDADAKADTVDEHVGDLSELETEDKTSAVDAINEVLSKIPVMTKEVTGNPITVDDALNADVVSLGVELTPVQDLHGYDKPWAGGTEANRFDVENAGLVQGSWSAAGNPLNVYTENYIKVLPETEYYYRDSIQANGRYIRCYDSNKDYLDVQITQYNTPEFTFTTAANTEYIQVMWYRVTDITPTEVAGASVAVNYPSTVTTYTPYSNVCPISGHDSVTVGVTDGDTQSHSTTVTLPSTVYGGDVDVTGGAGKETQAIVDLGDLNWSRQANQSGLYAMIAYPTGINTGVIGEDNLLCTAYAHIPCINANTATESNFPNGAICQSSGGGSIRIRDDSYTNATAFKTAVAGVKVTYKLATPTDLSTTPTDITLYNGGNVVSADGDMDMVYVRDIVKIIEKLEG